MHIKYEIYIKVNVLYNNDVKKTRGRYGQKVDLPNNSCQTV